MSMAAFEASHLFDLDSSLCAEILFGWLDLHALTRADLAMCCRRLRVLWLSALRTKGPTIRQKVFKYFVKKLNSFLKWCNSRGVHRFESVGFPKITGQLSMQRLELFLISAGEHLRAVEVDLKLDTRDEDEKPLILINQYCLHLKHVSLINIFATAREFGTFLHELRHSLRSLNLCFGIVYNAHQLSSLHLPGVQDLCVWDGTMGKVGAALLHACPALKRLSINNCTCTAIFQTLVLTKPVLQFLSLSTTSIVSVESFMATVPVFSSLRWINLPKCDGLTDDCITALLTHCTQLTSISFPAFDGQCFKNRTLYAIAKHCPQVRHLWVDVSTTTVNGWIAVINACTYLEDVSIARIKVVKDIVLARLLKACGELPNLVTLELDGIINVGNASLQALAKNCSGLTFLAVCNCGTFCSDLSLLPAVSFQLRKLQTLVLDSTSSVRAIGIQQKFRPGVVLCTKSRHAPHWEKFYTFPWEDDTDIGSY
jgi:hypothetical protein